MSWFSMPRGDMNCPLPCTPFPLAMFAFGFKMCKTCLLCCSIADCLPLCSLLCPISLGSGCLFPVLQPGLITLSSVTTLLQTGTLFLNRAPHPRCKEISLRLLYQYVKVSAFLGLATEDSLVQTQALHLPLHSWSPPGTSQLSLRRPGRSGSLHLWCHEGGHFGEETPGLAGFSGTWLPFEAALRPETLARCGVRVWCAGEVHRGG